MDYLKTVKQSDIIKFVMDLNFKTYQELLNKKINIKIEDKNGNTFLLYYLHNNKNPTIEMIDLLKNEINATDKNKNTALMFYCSNNINLNPEIIEYFSNQIGKQNDLGGTALMYYFKNNDNPKINIIKLLEKEINLEDLEKFNSLIIYITKNIPHLNPEIINCLSGLIGKQTITYACALTLYLHNNTKPNIEDIKLLEKEKNIIDNNNNTPLMSYCSNPNITYVDKQIIKYFSDQIGKQNKLGETALLGYLSFNKNPSVEIIEILKDEEDLITKFNMNILMAYCCNCNTEKLNIELIKKIIDKKNSKDSSGYKAFTYLSVNKNLYNKATNVVKELLK